MSNSFSQPPIQNPLRSHRQAVAFCVLAFIIASLIFDRAFDTYDDGIASTTAWLVLKGKVPYRDFWTIYSPGTCWVNAVLLKVFGESLFAIRLVLPLLVTVQAGFFYGILQRVVVKPVYKVAVCLCFLAFIPVGLFVTHSLTYWFTFFMAVAYFTARWVYDPRPKWEYACGLCLGVSVLFRQDGGIYTAAALLPLLYVITSRISVNRLRTILRIYGSFAAVVIVVLVYFASKGALGELYEDTARFAIFGFPGSRQVPYPVPWVMSSYGVRFAPPFTVELIFRSFIYYLLPVSLMILACISFIRLIKSKSTPAEITAYVLVCLAVVLFLMIRVRPAPMRITASVIFGIVSYAFYASDPSVKIRRFALSMLILSLVAMVPAGIFNIWVQRNVYKEPITVRGGIYAFEGYGAAVSMASSFIRERTSPDEKILAGTPLIYFTAGREPVTKYFEPHPKIIDRPDVQREIIRNMEREHVGYYVRSRKGRSDAYFATEREYEPKMVIDYINRNYERTLDLWLLQVYERRTEFGEDIPIADTPNR